jgi:CO/xanthine dehydrogenase FAD-binding subunit
MTTFYRRLPKFDYLSPKSLSDLWELMRGTNGSDYKLYAGGTDVIPNLKRRKGKVPNALIDLKGIQELDYIRYDARAGLAIGALASVHAVAHSCLVWEHYPALAIAAGKIGATQIQHRATVTGNICNAAPSADTAPALLALDASVRCASAVGERIIPLKDFFAGPLQNRLTQGEIVTEILAPRSSAGPRSCYIKLSPRKTLDLAVVGVAAFLSATDGRCEEIRIGLGAVGPTPMRALAAESTLRGERLTQDNVERAARAASEECSPRDSIRGSAAYRRAMVAVLVARAIGQLLAGQPSGATC